MENVLIKKKKTKKRWKDEKEGKNFGDLGSDKFSSIQLLSISKWLFSSKKSTIKAHFLFTLSLTQLITEVFLHF
jgi:hypothetical protein